MMSVEESHERRQRFWSYILRGTDILYLDHNTITQPEIVDVELKRQMADQIGEQVEYSGAPLIDRYVDGEISPEKIGLTAGYSDNIARTGMRGYVDSDDRFSVCDCLRNRYDWNFVVECIEC